MKKYFLAVSFFSLLVFHQNLKAAETQLTTSPDQQSIERTISDAESVSDDYLISVIIKLIQENKSDKLVVADIITAAEKSHPDIIKKIVVVIDKSPDSTGYGSAALDVASVIKEVRPDIAKAAKEASSSEASRSPDNSLKNNANKDGQKRTEQDIRDEGQTADKASYTRENYTNPVPPISGGVAP